MTVWKDIPGENGRYQVSDDGQVRSMRFAKQHRVGLLKQQIDGRGYRFVQLSNRKRRSVHSLVLLAFVGPRPSDKPSINHINGNQSDNNVGNLEYCTCSDNSKHAYATGLGDNHGENHSRHKLTNEDVFEIRRRLAAGQGVTSIAKRFGVVQSNISHIKSGKRWSHLIACEGGVPSVG